MSHGLSLWLLLFDLTRLAVLVLLVTKGGRYERILAASFIPAWLVEQAAMWLPEGGWALAVGAAGEVGLLTVHLWVLWRHRPASLVLAALFLAGETALALGGVSATDAPGGLAGLAAALAYARLACLAAGVVWRRLGPPTPLPEAEQGSSAAEAVRPAA